MIAERAEQLHELINRYQQARHDKVDADRLSTLLGRIQDARSRLQIVLPALRALDDLSLVSQLPGFAEVAQEVGHARSAAGTGVRDFIDTDDCAQLLSSLEATADQANTQVIQAWQRFLAQNQQRVPTDLLRALSRVDEYRDVAQRALATVVDLRRATVGSAAVPTPDSIQAAVEARKKLDAALTQIQQSVPSGVQNALRRCLSPEGLPLGEASEEFRNWMRAHDVEGTFVIRIQ